MKMSSYVSEIYKVSNIEDRVKILKSEICFYETIEGAEQYVEDLKKELGSIE